MSSTTQTSSQTPEPEVPELSTAATPVSDKRTAATGVIPKRMQSWIFLSVLAVVAVGLWFSSGSTNAAKPRPGTISAVADQVRPTVSGLSPDEVRARTKDNDDATRNTAASHNADANPTQSTDAQFKATFGDLNQANDPTQNQNPLHTTPRDPIQDEERKREYEGRFASNIALSYRSDSRAGTSSTPPPASTSSLTNGPADLTGPQSGLPGLPGDFQQQLQTLQAQQEKLLAQAQQQLAAATGIQPPATTQPQPQNAPPQPQHNAELNMATGKNHVIFEGTTLESVLVNRLNSDFAGPVICQLSSDVYSHDHAELLIPAGSRILGETKKVNDVGQERLAVIFHRLIMPDGYAVDLDQAPGLNQIGETALKDKVNNHYFKIFGSSIAVGAIAGLASIGANNSTVTGLPTSNTSA